MNDKPATYHVIAAAVHWLTALLVLAIFPIGIYMAEFVDDSNILLKFQLFQWHKSIGITILLLTLFRIIWRLSHKVPPLPENLKPWERAAARITHVGFYVLLLIVPLTGWAAVSSAPIAIPTYLYQTIPWPHISWIAESPNKEALNIIFVRGHFVLMIAMTLTIALHLGAVAKHTFILRDNTLERMLPWRKKSKRNLSEQ